MTAEYKVVKLLSNSKPSNLEAALNDGWMVYKISDTGDMIVYILWRPIIHQQEVEVKSWMKTAGEEA